MAVPPPSTSCRVRKSSLRMQPPESPHSVRRLLVVVCGLLLGTACTVFCASSTAQEEEHPTPLLDDFFAQLDKNGDGQIEEREALSFIASTVGGVEYDSSQEQEQAAAQVLGALDSFDTGSTVSVAELDAHLHHVLSGVRVWDWVRHGLGLPQYADAFKQHAITPLDFPMLVTDNGGLLEQELGLSNQLHRAKLLRAIRLQIIGLGKPPSEPQVLACNARGEAGGVVLWWSAPEDPGQPLLHKYVLERMGSGGQWQVVLEAEDVAVYVDKAVQEAQPGMGPGQALYRLSAWNMYSRSPFATAVCNVTATPDGSGVGALGANATLKHSRRSRHGGGHAHPHGGGGGVSSFWDLAQWNSIVLLLLPWILRLLPAPVLARLGQLLRRLATTYGASTEKGDASSQHRTPGAAVVASEGQLPAPGSGSPVGGPGSAFYAAGVAEYLTRQSVSRCNSGDVSLYTPLPLTASLGTAYSGTPPLQPALGGSLLGPAGGAGAALAHGLLGTAASSSPGLNMHMHMQSLGLPPQMLLAKSGSTGDLANGLGGSPVPAMGSYQQPGNQMDAARPQQEQDPALVPGAAAAASHAWRPPTTPPRGKACAHPGCGRRLDILHFRDYQRRHYCGRCQQVFCLAHTSYSPHGPTGSCGHESRCVCVSCITHFNAPYRAFLEQRNTLRSVAPPSARGVRWAAGSASGASGGSAAGGAEAGGSGRGGSRSASGATAADGAVGGIGGSSSSTGVVAEFDGAIPEAEAAGQPAGDGDGGGSSSTRLLWQRAACKLKAVGRLRKGGAAK